MHCDPSPNPEVKKTFTRVNSSESASLNLFVIFLLGACTRYVVVSMDQGQGCTMKPLQAYRLTVCDAVAAWGHSRSTSVLTPHLAGKLFSQPLQPLLPDQLLPQGNASVMLGLLQPTPATLYVADQLALRWRVGPHVAGLNQGLDVEDCHLYVGPLSIPTKRTFCHSFKIKLKSTVRTIES